MNCLRKVDRRVGQLESFRKCPSDNFAAVRIDGTLFKLPVSARGVLQPDGAILLCANGERYNSIEPNTSIAVDLVFDAKGENPVTGPWAPKQKPPQS